MVPKNITTVTEFILLGLSSQPWVKHFLFAIFIWVYVTTVTANVLIIIVFMTTRSLRTPMYFFLINLAFMDLCVSSTIVPRTLKDLMSDKASISYTECVAQMYISLALGENEGILLAIMAYDRYIAICHPLHYTTIINKYVCFKIGAIAWTWGLVLSIPSAALTFNVDLCGHNEINHFFCEQPEILSLGCENVKNVELVTFLLCVIVAMSPLIFIHVSYIKIIIAILSIRSSAGPKKTFSTCSSHLIVVILFYGSATASYMKPRSNSTTGTGKIFPVFYGTITPMLNPLIYTLRNDKVKASLWKHLQK
ncbi:putative olfactory receptor 2B3 [Discoglossus pictus]